MTKQKRDIHQEVTNKIIAALEQGVAPWVRPWAVTGNGMPTNAVSKKAYRGINVLLLWSRAMEAGYTSPYWLTYKQAQQLGGNVKRGEKAEHIVWNSVKIYENENKLTGEKEEKKVFLTKYYTVFNAEQCENLPGKFYPKAEEHKHNEEDAPDYYWSVRQFIDLLGAEIAHGGDKAAYLPSADSIILPEQNRFPNIDDYFSTSLHEHVHWTGAKHRLNRLDMFNKFGDESYAAEELVAEMGAAFLCAELGIEGKLQHAEYISSWLRVLKNDKKAIFKASTQASRAVEYLNELVEINNDERNESIAA